MENLPESKGPFRPTDLQNQLPDLALFSRLLWKPRKHLGHDLEFPVTWGMIWSCLIWFLDFNFCFDPWSTFLHPYASFSFPKAPWLDEVSSYYLLLCFSYTLCASILDSESLQFCNSGEKNVVSLRWRATCSLLSISQTPATGEGHVGAAAFGPEETVFFMELGTPVGVTFLGPKIERNQNKMYTGKSTLRNVWKYPSSVLRCVIQIAWWL